MDTTALDIMMLPLELFRAILAEMMLVRGVKRALRLRLVNREWTASSIPLRWYLSASS